METNVELAKQAKDGDDDAFEEIVRRELPHVYAFLARYLGDESAAEDATQETFVKAWRNLRKFDPLRPIRPWLLQIARNTATDTYRRRRALPFSRLWPQQKEDDGSFEDTIVDDSPLPEELFERAELGDTVAKALKELSERDRAVLVLRYEEDLSFDDIATTMKAPMNTVKSWHRRALKRLRALLERGAPGRGLDT